MSKKNKPAVPASQPTTLKKVGRFANVADAVCAIIFLGLALYSGWWFWWASAAFCAFTAATSPLEKFGSFMLNKTVTVKSSR